MENAVIRGAGKHPCEVGSDCIVGPFAHVSGASVSDACFIATGAAVFNGAVLEDGVVVCVHGIVHIKTLCRRGLRIPMGHIAYGNPARVFRPEEAPLVHNALAEVGFSAVVFGIPDRLMARSEYVPAMKWIFERYSRSLSRHAEDEIVAVQGNE